MAPKFCPRCGAQQAGEFAFCPGCGLDLRSVADPTTAARAEVAGVFGAGDTGVAPAPTPRTAVDVVPPGTPADRAVLSNEMNAALDAVMQPGEHLFVVQKGISRGEALAASDRRFFLWKKGVLRQYPFGSVTSIAWNESGLTRWVWFRGPGLDTRQPSTWNISGHSDALDVPRSTPSQVREALDALSALAPPAGSSLPRAAMTYTPPAAAPQADAKRSPSKQKPVVVKSYKAATEGGARKDFEKDANNLAKKGYKVHSVVEKAPSRGYFTRDIGREFVVTYVDADES